jgi:hypothetical protein
MYIQTWNKYLPVIKILLKRSLNSEQKLDMNGTDFQRAAAGKKTKYNFSVFLVRARAQNGDTIPPIAKDLITVLQQDDTTFKFLRIHDVEFTMSSNFQLLIKNTTPAASEPSADVEDGSNGNG